MPVLLRDMRQLVYDRLEKNDVFYTEAEVDYGINEAIAVFNLATRTLQKTYNVVSIINRRIYDVPVELLLLTRVDWENVTLDPWGLTGISQTYNDWLTQTTAQISHEPSHWVTIGNRKFALHPADSYGGGAISCTGVIEPIPLVEATDVMPLPIQYAENMADYAAHVSVLDEGGAGFAATMPMFRSFNEATGWSAAYSTVTSRAAAASERLRN